MFIVAFDPTLIKDLSHLTSPHPTPRHLTSPHLPSPHLIFISSHLISSPHLTSSSSHLISSHLICNGCLAESDVDVRAWISNYIPQETMNILLIPTPTCVSENVSPCQMMVTCHMKQSLLYAYLNIIATILQNKSTCC